MECELPEMVLRHIVVVGARFPDEQQDARPIGSGFLVGYQGPTGSTRRPIIATAGHVVDHDVQDSTEWTITRLAFNGNPPRVARFVTPAEDPAGAQVVWYSGKWAGTKHSTQSGPCVDIGAITFSNQACPGGFSDADEQPPRLINRGVGLTPGTPVGWAGFPEHARRMLGQAQLCCFRGVISSVVDQPNLPPMYLIDGHNTPGLSGSPVWWWNPDKSRAEIAAVVTRYSFLAEFPGFVLATPIHILVEYFRKNTASSQEHL